jgi:hypothetical protein
MERRGRANREGIPTAQVEVTMTEKQIRERLATALPAETAIVCLYLVAAVFDSPPPTVTYDPTPRYMAPMPEGTKVK